MKRRPFIKKLIQSTGGIYLASQSPLLYGCNLEPKNKKLGIALVGLGGYAGGQLAPALLETEHCYLAGIVTGTKEKESIWVNKYNIKKENIYNYDNFDSIAANDDIDIVYVVLPNSMHAEFTIRAAKAGKHVICEKPMAVSVEECENMIAACKEAKKMLSIGYRLHFDPFHDEVMRIGQNKVYGNMNVESEFSFLLKNPDSWRTQKALAGGGPLMDLGIYAIQGSIYSFGELPTSLWAKNTTKDTEFFKDIEGSLEWELTFPSGKSYCKTSYETPIFAELKHITEKGEVKLENAFYYGGIKGSTPDGNMNIKPVNQQASQMDAFALNILNNTESIVPGEMGLRDNYIIEKIYDSAANNSEVLELNDIPNILDIRRA
ncbi:Gfo/Idh/MocA family oxidoreductase [Flaviramulus sp. BrNp1-15]|uniref:Gfo/Idh/MocA family protein n=1 Tax=Flaviramulus sp. BrNp1-15 TaxID=2916754 RepID=UPI001EE92D55|nr:Gfo/Idh/MocA family oxidoreductase [Flaviramulus sp. BrNp1-15]ULC58739.1 Gfo/Idh/MocA family oxidoreductase [Flaviramulus sp. BrNp1-15]